MIPLPSRLLIAAASWIVPASKRAEWRREWEAELWHRAEVGAQPEELLRRALGAFRDAAFLLQQHRKQYGFDLFQRPLRTEALFVGFALLCCLLFGAFRAPRLPLRDARQIVVFERNVAFAGSIDPRINPRLMRVWKAGKSFSD
ncbi:MAG: hypothetical protein JO022_08220, partial [Acidobacteriaceae bacterium]|nr:hypothetical protein [Acidobacteriaceae bacterium]